MALQAVGIGCSQGSIVLGIFSILTCLIPLSVLPLSIAGVFSAIVGVRDVNGIRVSAIVGLVLNALALLFAIL